MTELTLKVQKVSTTAKLPVKAYDTDAGIDFFSNKTIKITGGSTTIIPTGIKVEIPAGYCLVGRDRSGLASSTSLIVKAGVIDETYRGEVKIVIGNHGGYPIKIRNDDKIAQFLLVEVPKVKIEEGEVSEYTDRGTKGFGSSDGTNYIFATGNTDCLKVDLTDRRLTDTSFVDKITDSNLKKEVKKVIADNKNVIEKIIKIEKPKKVKNETSNTAGKTNRTAKTTKSKK